MLAAGYVSSANAADAVVYEPAVPMPADMYNWSGFYVGGQAGYGWGDADYAADAGGGVAGTFDIDGAFAGGNAGFNIQNGSWVFGVEGDVFWSGIEGSGTAFDGDVITAEIHWMGSLRGRVGYAFDNVLPYVTAGVAVSDTEIAIYSDPDTLFGRDSNTHVGWTAGLGVEVGLSQNISTSLEYRYTDLGTKDYVFGPVDATGTGEVHTVGAALKWRFGQ
jgi:outer membrane immunogenic protein